MNISVSIIMPVHNGVRFVRDAINSVLAQTYKMFELIVIDDGSTDGSQYIIEELANKDVRIKKIFRDKASGGPAIPRNQGLDIACGRFIAFLDCDDIWYATKLEKQVSFMVEESAVLSYTAYQRISEDGGCLRKVQIPKAMAYKDLLQNTAIATSSAMFDRSIVGNEHFLQLGHEDYAFWLRLVRKYGRCFGLNEELLLYRVVDGSMSSGKLKSIMWVWRIYRQCESLSIPHSMWCLANYGFRATVKRIVLSY